MDNIDRAVVHDFGREWSAYDQSDLDAAEAKRIFDGYFASFPWSTLPPNAVGIDIGCGSGRWAKLVAPKVGRLICVDPSADARKVAAQNLSGLANCSVEAGAANSISYPDATFDFAYSLGVLHHAPDTQSAMAACVAKLKPGAPFLVYLYYAFDNRPAWFRAIWRTSEIGRAVISRLPSFAKVVVTKTIAALVYWPLARTAKMVEALGLNANGLPLSFYRNKSFYTMQTDALDRFGTRLEQRFTRAEIEHMMAAAGLKDIVFNENEPYWCAVGIKR